MTKEEIKLILEPVKAATVSNKEPSAHNQFVDRTKAELEYMLSAIEFEEKYGIKVKDYRCSLNNYFEVECSIYKTCYIIKWGEKSEILNSKAQPKIGSFLYSLQFSTGAYIFGNDYDTELFNDFYEELKTFNPDFEDPLNDKLYWYVENARTISRKIDSIYKKYLKKHSERRTKNEIQKLEEQLKRLKGE